MPMQEPSKGTSCYPTRVSVSSSLAIPYYVWVIAHTSLSFLSHWLALVERTMAENTTGISIMAIDHVVLTVADVPATVDFYCRILGMRHEVFVSPKNPDVER